MSYLKEAQNGTLFRQLNTYLTGEDRMQNSKTDDLSNVDGYKTVNIRIRDSRKLRDAAHKRETSLIDLLSEAISSL